MCVCDGERQRVPDLSVNAQSITQERTVSGPAGQTDGRTDTWVDRRACGEHEDCKDGRVRGLTGGGGVVRGEHEDCKDDRVRGLTGGGVSVGSTQTARMAGYAADPTGGCPG